ncbi:protein polybromo-1, partial [Paragonimus westermani]
QGIRTAGDAYQVPMNMVAPPNAGPSGLHPNPQAQPGMPLLQRVILELFQTIREYHINGRQLSTHFMRLPTRTELPTYYEFIKRPIELQTIAKQVVQMRYPDFEEFVADLFLMFDNACRFNEPNSQIYSDALILHRVCLAKRTAILNTFASHLGIPPSVPPDVVTGIRRLLTNLHNAMLTACDPDGRGLVDSLIAGDGTEAALTSVTATRLAALHRAVAAGCYRRLDRLQHDWLKILKRARVGEGSGGSVNSPNPLPTMQQRLDAAELARRWVRLRDELCHRQQRRCVIFPFTTSPQAAATADSVGALPSHLSLLSPAMTYTMAALDRELTEEDATYKISVYGDEQGEGTLPELCGDESEATEVYVRTQPYHVGDYVYVEPLRPNVGHCHIGRIVRIAQKTPSNQDHQTKNAADSSELQSDVPSQPTSDSATECSAPTPSTFKVFVAWYWRSSEARPSRRRRLLTSEVFRTALIEAIPLGKLMGRCLVLPISQFIRFRPKNVDERDVFICESQFSIKSQTFVKIRNWDIPTPVGIEMEPRPVPFVPTRLPPSEPLENALEQVDTSIYTDVTYPLPRVYEASCIISGGLSIILDDPTRTDDDIVYEQYVHQNGFLVKLGDFLYIPAAIDSSERHIVRVDKLWKSVKQNVIFVSGPWFIAPSAVEHLPTRVFYPKEVFLTSAEHATHALASATGKCYIMRPVDYCQARPTDFNEQDVYLCDCKYFEDEKVIRKLKKGLKKFQLSVSAYEDEFYFFPQPMCPRKMLTGIASILVPTVDAGNFAVASTFLDYTECAHLTGKTFARLLPSSRPLSRKLRKPPSGYVLYAGEVRKRLLQERRDAPFGEISREVGLMWRQMPQSQRDFYERKAKLIKRRMEEEELRVKLREQELARIQLQQQQLASAATATAMTLDERHTVSMLQPHSAVPTLVGQPMSVQPHMVVSAPTAPRHNIGASPTPAAANVQFYQTPSGQVIQIVHAQPAPSANSSVGPTPGQQSNVTTAATFSQAPFAALPPLSSGCALPPGGTHQVLYQLSSQPGTMVPASSIGSGTPQSTYFHPQQQRILVASNAGSTSGGTVTAVVGSGAHVSANIVSGSPTTPHTQILLATTGGLTSNVASVLPTHPLTHSQPNISLMSHASAGAPSSTVQPLVAPGAPHEFTGHVQPHFQLVQQTHQPIYPTAVVSASTAHATPFVSSAQAPNLQITSSVQQQQINRAPSPIFVSTPPRTSRVLHSEIYQRYINRLRKNVQGGLSDWRSQLSVTPETAPNLPANVANQLAGNFLANPQNHAHHASVTEAVWSLRDHLLEDALKIRLRYLNSVECL